jgi:hypothetical protein
MPLMPTTSISPGWCTGSLQPRTSCFGSLPLDQCSIEFAEDTMAGKVVKWWQIAFRLQTPLSVGEYVDVSLPGFDQYIQTDGPLLSPVVTTSSKTTIFAFEIMAKSVDPGFPVTLPDLAPEYMKIGCYDDVRARRAVGGGTCGNFKDSDGVVTSVDACARIAVDRGFRGFCVADGSTCMTSRDFFLEYDTYNRSDDLGELEALAHAEYEAEMRDELEACLNASNKTGKLGTQSIFEAYTDGAASSSSSSNTSNASSRCAPSRKFVFNTTGMKGCLKSGMGGPGGTMNCYELMRKPKLAAKIAPMIRCGQCAEWDATTQTLRFVAEEYVEAGLDLVLGFNSSVLALRAPVHGLAKDDKSISTMHSRDVRDVNTRDKERSICTVPAIPPAVPENTNCVPPNVSRTVQVLCV